jgi:REP element-mobilizing transposase RayT
MARPLRIEYPGAFYHVMNRGNAGEDLFKTKRDGEKFVEYLEKASERFSIKIHVYCLMRNHYHLLVETPDANLSKAIQWLNVSFATYVNRKRNRHGHLFQGRFKSILVEADEYLKELSRYIHLNPVRGNIVANPEKYQWSSYPDYVGKRKPPGWLEREWLLSWFGKRKKEAEARYREFVQQVDPMGLENPEKLLRGGSILGTSDFVDWVKDTFLSSMSDDKEVPHLRQLKSSVDIEKVIEEVAKTFGCSRELIIGQGKKRNLPRDVAIYLARDLTGKSARKLGDYFGNVSGAAITMKYKTMENKIKKEKRLARKAIKIMKILGSDLKY